MARAPRKPRGRIRTSRPPVRSETRLTFQDTDMPRSLIFMALAALSLSACAAEPGAVPAARAATATKPAAAAAAKTDAARPAAAPAVASDAAIRAAVAKAVPNLKIDGIQNSPLPGYKEVAIGGRV